MISLRSWATPLTIGAFVLLAVTGVLMFYHLDTGLNKTAHEWLSWFFIIGAVGHIVVNLPSIKKHLSAKLGRSIIGLFILLLAGSFLALGGSGGRQSPVRAVMQGIANAPMETVAAVAGTTTDAVMERLRASGYAVSGAEQTIHDLSGGDRKRENELIKIVFAAPKS